MSASEARSGIAAPHVLREYALLADGERGALVGPHGDFAWLCFPRWDSRRRLLRADRRHRRLRGHPAGRFVWGGYYEPGSLIWRSRWVTGDAIIECREALALPARRRPRRDPAPRDRSARHAHASTSSSTRAPGSATTRSPGWPRAEDGRWTGRTGDVHVALERRRPTPARTRRPPRQALTLDLELARGRPPRLRARARPEQDAHRAAAGRRARLAGRPRRRGASASPSSATRSPPRDARHAYAVLRGLTSAGGGDGRRRHHLAARARRARPQLRLPLRRGSATSATPARPSPRPAPTHSSTTRSRFVGDRLLDRRRHLAPAYTIDGDAVPDQRDLELPGYPGGTDDRRQLGQRAVPARRVRRGAAAVRRRRPPRPPRHRRLARRRDRREGDRAALAPNPTPASGRSTPTTGRTAASSCAAGLRAISRRAPGRRAGRPTGSRSPTASSPTPPQRALHPSGRWQRSPDDPRLDAALLLAAIRGAIPADDPRTLATLHAVAAELTQDGYCYRYRPDERPLGQCRRRLPAVRALDGTRLPPARRTRRAPPAGSNATAPPADHPGCSPRSSTSPSANCAATCPKPSSTRSCSNAPPP